MDRQEMCRRAHHRVSNILVPDQEERFSTIMKRYEIQSTIGRGSQGLVLRARDRRSDILVAVKEIYTTNKGQDFSSRITREICILRGIRHPNIVRLLDVVYKKDEVQLIFDLMDVDLKKFLNSNPLVVHGQFSPKIKIFLHQILAGIAYCHSHQIIHRDLKPQNLLIISDWDVLRIADFGSARREVPQLQYTTNIGTYLYAAPEILLGSRQYSTAVDVWSVGCIFAEMVIQRPLFEVEGRGLMNTYIKIFRIMGTPTEETWPGVNSFCDSLRHYEVHEAQNLAHFVPGLEDAGIDLLSRMLRMNPSQRITASEALNHEYFNDLVPYSPFIPDRNIQNPGVLL